MFLHGAICFFNPANFPPPNAMPQVLLHAPARIKCSPEEYSIACLPQPMTNITPANFLRQKNKLETPPHPEEISSLSGQGNAHRFFKCNALHYAIGLSGLPQRPFFAGSTLIL
jgi:hypothetical protein